MVHGPKLGIKMKNTKIILIEGFNKSGKSTLAHNLKLELPNSIVLCNPVMGTNKELYNKWKSLYDATETEDERALLQFIQHLWVSEKVKEFIHGSFYERSSSNLNMSYVILDEWWLSTLVYNRAMYVPVITFIKRALFPVDLLVLCETSFNTTNNRLEAFGETKVNKADYDYYTQSYNSWLRFVVEEGLAKKTLRVNTDRLSEESVVRKVLREVG